MTLPLGDLHNASRFREDHGERVRFARALGWLCWDGCRWRPDNTGEVERLARDTLAENFRRASADGNKEAVRFAAESTNDHRIRAALHLAQSELGIAADAAVFDRHPWLLNTASGVVDLTTGSLAPHDPALFLTKLATAFYSEAATCLRWLTFLDQIFDHELALVEYVQRIVGYALTGDTGEQCFFVLWGVGANGKSTLVETVRAILGDYATQTPTDTLMLRGNDGIGNDVARLRGARFVAAVESAEGRRLNETLVKRLTGEDTIAARFLYKEHFEFRPVGKIFIATNHRPVVVGTDLGLWRRVRLVPFTVTIPPEQQDRHLREKLLAESAGILRWAVEGALAWQKHGLGDPPAVIEATASYRAESDRLAPFLAERCVIAPGLTGFNLYQEYLTWAGANGEPPLSGRDFAIRMAEKGFATERRFRGRVFLGVGLRAEDMDHVGM